LKWYHSIITKISLIFALAIIGIIALLFAFAQNQKTIELDNMEKFARVVIHNSFDRKSKKISLEKLNQHGFSLVKDKKLKAIISTNIGYQNQHKKMMNNFRGGNRFGIKAVAFKRFIYITVKYPAKELIILKSSFEKEFLPTLILPIIAILFVLFLYIAIIKSILPLYSLKNKIKEFADGNYDIDCKSNKKDEIAILSNEFDTTVKKIKKLRDSRQLFLRNIMHEFKTPITKGKLVSEMLEDSTYQDTLKNLFRRQESLLDDFSKIEKLSADELKINTQQYNLQDIVDFSLDILSHDKELVNSDLSAMSLHVDFELFATAIKNLLDNGINYSDNKSVKITSNENKIIISNTGKALEFPLDRYSEPYFLDGSKQKSSRGLGFGLYITWHVIRLHNMTLSYQREAEENIFTITT